MPCYSPQNISSPAGGEVAQVTGGCDEGGKPPRARLGEHDGLNLTWNNRTFCGVLCTVSAHATERMPGNVLRSPDGNHAGFARIPSVYYRKLTRTGERRAHGRSDDDTVLCKFVRQRHNRA